MAESMQLEPPVLHKTGDDGCVTRSYRLVNMLYLYLIDGCQARYYIIVILISLLDIYFLYFIT